MELRDFVSETLVQIVKGIESANASLAPDKEQPFKLGYSGVTVHKPHTSSLMLPLRLKSAKLHKEKRNW